MKIEYLFFIVLSALFHAFYNFLMRRHAGSRAFLTGMFIVAAIISIFISIFYFDPINITFRNMFIIYCASFFYVLYQIFVSKSYEYGKISTHYPLTVLSPIFVPIWAFFLLSEKISIITLSGVFITVLSAIFVNLETFSIIEIRKMISFKREHIGARYALAASFMYSFGAIFDKSAVANFPLPLYLSFILLFMSINLLIFQLFDKREPFAFSLSSGSITLLMAGLILYLSFLFFRISLREVSVSVAVPLRLIAIFFAILFGVFFLKEPFKKRKIAGSVGIILGIILINYGI